MGTQMMAPQCSWSVMTEWVPEGDPASPTVVTVEALSSMRARDRALMFKECSHVLAIELSVSHTYLILM